jgi:predicted metallopeptidase
MKRQRVSRMMDKVDLFHFSALHVTVSFSGGLREAR